MPTKLGEVTSGPTVTLTDYGTTQFTIAATYSVAAEMKPWAGVYQLGIVFDGKVVETHPTLTAAGDAVQIAATAWCDAASAATNKHTIQLRGRLPFAPSVETTSAPLDFVCPAPRIGTPPNNGAVPPATGGSSSGDNGNNGGTSSTGDRGRLFDEPRLARRLGQLRWVSSSGSRRSFGARGAASHQRRIGCMAPYVNERQSHSTGPKRKRRSQSALATTCATKSATPIAAALASPRRPKRPSPQP